MTPQGMTVTDNERKVFFRQHFHMKSILCCGIDPSDKSFFRGGVHSKCHLFGEISKDWPSSILVNILNRSMASST
ncbi:unnamed protein product [Porites evermanni]|uniref:Uncharacterized protein n=1 Tax=Porites evermanni TaxID=104178 RepID=A0ABN8RC26_9CNID|nr:unnamed protein product [Porites evermanni]